MKKDRLLAKMDALGVEVPHQGTGRNGAVTNEDLRTALGDYFFSVKYDVDRTYDDEYLGGVTRPYHARLAEAAAHCALRRKVDPMKAFRYDKLREEEKQNLWDSSDWIAEEKVNGFRAMLTYIPACGFGVFSGNRSDVDFLPMDYTEKTLIGGLRPWDEAFHNLFDTSFIIDAEAVCEAEIETKSGTFSHNTLSGIQAVWSVNAEESVAHQRGGAVINFHCFDYIPMDEPSPTEFTNNARRVALNAVLREMTKFGQLQAVLREFDDKTALLRKVWNSGGEGVILKNKYAHYDAGGRHRQIAVKVKRSMSGEVGDDIDAFIGGTVLTPEWSKKGLIGGVKLYVYDKATEGQQEPQAVEIATVTSMPDALREELTTYNLHGKLCVKAAYYGKVVVVDGQELSARNRKLMHAVVDWKRGFREDKFAMDCWFDFGDIDDVMF